MIVRLGNWRRHGRYANLSWCLENESCMMWAVWTGTFSSWNTASENKLCKIGLSWSFKKVTLALSETWTSTVTMSPTNNYGISAVSLVVVNNLINLTRSQKQSKCRLLWPKVLAPLLQHPGFMICHFCLLFAAYFFLRFSS